MRELDSFVCSDEDASFVSASWHLRAHPNHELQPRPIVSAGEILPRCDLQPYSTLLTYHFLCLGLTGRTQAAPDQAQHPWLLLLLLLLLPFLRIPTTFPPPLPRNLIFPLTDMLLRLPRLIPAWRTSLNGRGRRRMSSPNRRGSSRKVNLILEGAGLGSSLAQSVKGSRSSAIVSSHAPTVAREDWLQSGEFLFAPSASLSSLLPRVRASLPTSVLICLSRSLQPRRRTKGREG